MISEASIQKSIIEWCGHALKKDVVYWSTPNERKPSTMGALRSMGLKTGVSDLIFLRESIILFVEVKRPATYKIGKRGKNVIDQRAGTLSTEQEEFKNAVTLAGGHFYKVDNLPDFMQIMKSRGFAR